MNEYQRCQALIARADAMRHQHPRRAVVIAKSGRTLAATLSRTALGEARWLATQVEAWGVLGSAWRAVGDLARAEAAINVAICFLDAEAEAEGGAGTAGRRARLAQRAAYLRSSQQRLDEALPLIDEALGIYRALDRPRQAATCRVDRAAILAAGGRLREALGTLQAALASQAGDMPPRTYVAAVHNVALYLYELAESHSANLEALRWLRLAVRCHRRYPDNVGRLKLLFFQGLAALRVGATDDGVAALRAAADGFGRRGATHLHAAALTHLAAVHAGLGQRAALWRIAGELFPLLGRLRKRPEALAALLEVVRAIHTDAVSPALCEQAARALQRSLSPRGARTTPRGLR